MMVMKIIQQKVIPFLVMNDFNLNIDTWHCCDNWINIRKLISFGLLTQVCSKLLYLFILIIELGTNFGDTSIRIFGDLDLNSLMVLCRFQDYF